MSLNVNSDSLQHESLSLFQNIDEFIEQYQSQLIDLTSKLNSFGLSLLPYSAATWLRFKDMNTQQQQSSYSRFQFYYEICQDCLVDGNSLKGNNKLLWYAIRKMNLRPKSDLFDKISQEDVVEIYDSSFMQVYRNFNFFEICSYSLADLFMWEWRDLYYRDDEITQGLAIQGYQVFTVNPTTQRIQLNIHEVHEKFSTNKFKLKMTPGYFSPLLNKQGLVEAGVATSRVDIISSEAVKLEDSFELTKESLSKLTVV